MAVNKDNKKQHDISQSNYQIMAQEMAKLVVIRGENTSKFIEFSGKILLELGPQTEIERILCEKFIILSWKLKRLLEIERNLFNKQSAELTNEEDTKLYLKHVTGIRVRNIKKIDITDPSVIHVSKNQMELEKRIAKTLFRIREEQERRTGVQT